MVGKEVAKVAVKATWVSRINFRGKKRLKIKRGEKKGE